MQYAEVTKYELEDYSNHAHNVTCESSKKTEDFTNVVLVQYNGHSTLTTGATLD